jgi:hypothetical protein
MKESKRKAKVVATPTSRDEDAELTKKTKRKEVGEVRVGVT